LAAFRKHLETRFGSCARAWRVALDLRGHGEITAGEFGKGCRSVGWRHNHSSLFNELKKDGGGRATLRALDPEAAQSIDKLNSEVLERYGDVSALWWELLDAKGTGAVHRGEFVEHVGKELGLGAAAAKRVFTALDTQNSGWLAEAEVMFLEAFERFQTAEALSGAASVASWPPGCRSTDDSRLASNDEPAPSCSSSWEGAQRPAVWSPAKRTRSLQHRALAQTHAIKHRWVVESVMMERCALRPQSQLSNSSSRSQQGFKKNASLRTTSESFRATV
jgi:hypothetical protein